MRGLNNDNAIRKLVEVDGLLGVDVLKGCVQVIRGIQYSLVDGRGEDY